MKIATWNVNSLRVRLGHVLDWLDSERPDLLALQETKLQDEEFPAVELHEAGYHALFSGQKTYNGVAMLSRQPAVSDPITALPGWDDPQKRVLAATYGDVRLINLYVPNGSEVGSDKYDYKLAWLETLTGWLKEELERWPKLCVVGDFNIAPDERDVHNPKRWAGRVLFSDPERAAFRALEHIGLADTFRLFEQPERSFSWWDYRLGAFKKGMGLRIDHILASPALADRCAGCRIDPGPRGRERPSDHAPVVAEFTG